MKRILAALLTATLLASPALAAVTANSVITAQTPNRGVVQFIGGTDTAGTYKTLYTAGANGSKCFSVVMTNNDPSATHVVTVQLVNTAIKYGGTTLLSIVNAGFLTTAPPQVMMSPTQWPGLPVDGNSNQFIYMVSGDTLQATFATAITSSDVLNIQVQCADF